jgi:hypothetical protein
LRPALQAALQTQGFGINRQFAAATPAKVSLSEAYRGYSLTLDDLSQGKGLKDARVGDWHYLVFADGVSIADAQLAEVRGHVEFASLNHGTRAADTVGALKLAEQAPQLQGKALNCACCLSPRCTSWRSGCMRTVRMYIPIEPTPKELGDSGCTAKPRCSRCSNRRQIAPGSA